MIVPLTIVSLASPAFGADRRSALDPQDLQILARVLAFQTTPSTRSVKLAVVFNPANPGSVTEARDILATIADGVVAGNIVFQARSISQTDLATLDHVDAVLSTQGVDAEALRQALLRLHVPCLTLDLTQVTRGGCMVAIRSAPSVSIVFNQANADAARVHFATAFRMMVQEL